MQALLSYDLSPPLSAPLRFFFTAPLFGVLAGLLLIVHGPDALIMRWTPAALALTHLVTVGFMLQIMLGALIQILPVVVGVNLPSPNRLACRVHVLCTLGALALTLAFFSFDPWAFRAAAILFALGIGDFVVAVGSAFFGVRGVGATFFGLRIAVLGLTVTAGLGILLAGALGWSLGLPLVQLTDTHAVWGLVVWGCVLLAAVAYVVVPMFQLTPSYPLWFERRYASAALFAVLGWTALDYGVGHFFASAPPVWSGLPLLALFAVVGVVALFAAVSLKVMHGSQRATLDATQVLWRVGMFSALLACALWGLAQAVPLIAQWHAWPVLFGGLLLGGGFMSVILGMLYKIVPFLIWLHLQNRGQGRLMAPNMRKILPEVAMRRQMKLHLASGLALVAAVFWPQGGSQLAGVLVVLSHAALLYTLWAALKVCRAHEARLAEAAVVAAQSGVEGA